MAIAFMASIAQKQEVVVAMFGLAAFIAAVVWVCQFSKDMV
jgi:hypothetical protein